jgi:hypothetical protein
MKEYFKYNKGYVNINDENLFLTNSGNWSEILKIEEKSSKKIKKNTINAYKYGFIIIGILFYINIVKENENYHFDIALLVLGILAYFYMKRETGNQYKIPISKISNIVITNQQVKIIFTNADNEEEYEIIEQVEEKGINILKGVIKIL